MRGKPRGIGPEANKLDQAALKKYEDALFNIFYYETDQSLMVSEIPVVTRLDKSKSVPLFVKYFKTGDSGLRIAAYAYSKKMGEDYFKEVKMILETDKATEALRFIAVAESHISADIKIQTDRDFYTPLLSSTIGIGLTPKYPLEKQKGNLKFLWSTNYGIFLSWHNGVHALGPEVTNGGEQIFWSYDPKEIGKLKPPVQISLIIKDEETNIFLGGASIEIDWDKDVAKVKK